MDTNKNTRSLIEQTAHALIHYIISNKLQAGDKLPTEHELTLLLGVGRSTLREAVRTLTSRNVLEVRQGSGTFVSDKNGVSDDPLGFALMTDRIQLAHDIVEFRMMIEPRIAAMAAIRVTTEEKTALKEQCRKVEELITAHLPYAEEDSKLHTMIAKYSQNSIIPKLMPIITESVNLLIEVTHATLVDETVRTHRAIIDAICAGDAVAASDAMTLHMIYNRDRLRETPLIAPKTLLNK